MKGDMNLRKIIIASHGEFAKGLKNSITMIVGEMADEIDTFCLYPSESPMDFKETMEKEIGQNGNTQYIFLCDIKGGSVHTVWSQLCVYSNVRVFSGTNMNLVLDLLLSYQEGLDDEQAEQLLTNAKKGLTQMTRKDLIIENDEEF